MDVMCASGATSRHRKQVAERNVYGMLAARVSLSETVKRSVRLGCKLVMHSCVRIVQSFDDEVRILLLRQKIP